MVHFKRHKFFFTFQTTGANVRSRNLQGEDDNSWKIRALDTCLFTDFFSLVGLTAFDFISDFEEWIDCGYFNEEIQARLKGM